MHSTDKPIPRMVFCQAEAVGVMEQQLRRPETADLLEDDGDNLELTSGTHNMLLKGADAVDSEATQLRKVAAALNR